ncbi:flagellar biosynthetic protein FliR [Tepidicaulis sp. LMO-SS28]|uniref:flagellar biosynthetic protein FliR n=1 Tax=Tepidicaulis sp. LMO-SS28 TaxID=3447455 RepID=UPI003EE2C5A1
MIVTVAPETSFIFLMMFCRLGTMIMLMPALGEIIIPARIKLVVALALTAVMMPLVGDAYEGLPSTPLLLTWLVASEFMVGLLIGAAARLLMSATQVAGTIIAFQTGLAFAQNVDPTQGIQSALVGSFMAMLAVTMIFVTDLHHLLIAVMYDSYTLFKPGAALPLGDFVQLVTGIVSGMFKLGVQLAAPFIVFGLVFYMGLGILSRLMPQLQVFFIALPANILLGFVLFMVLIGVMMSWFLGYFEETIIQFTA